jgi:hypothetical protein
VRIRREAWGEKEIGKKINYNLFLCWTHRGYFRAVRQEKAEGLLVLSWLETMERVLDRFQ